MNISEAIVIIIGLSLFEVVSSVDNAIINADALATMSPRARRWFLVYGIIAAVFLVRGLLPLLIVYLSSPGVSIVQAFTATLSPNGALETIVSHSKPILLTGGGIYLIFLFFHWLFTEPKQYAFFIERHIHKNYSLWFYTAASVILVAVVSLAIRVRPTMALSAVIGSSAFFLAAGFKQNAEEEERRLKSRRASEASKLLYLELIDAAFSIDGVLGAFAFTISVPLILIGNGLGAFAVRYVTTNGAGFVKRYRYLKNGAMYSIGLLGLIMLGESLGLETAAWVPPAITFIVIGTFLWLSARELETEKAV